MSLYNFENGHLYLDEIGINRLDHYENHLVLHSTDFKQALDDGKIEYRDDGVYLNVKGNWQRGYYYMVDYEIIRYGHYPRFHLRNCQTMQNKHIYTGKYIWSNHPSVEVKERSSGKVHKNSTLDLCYNCSQIIMENIQDTLDFHEKNQTQFFMSQKKIEFQSIDVSVGPSGYPIKWREIATKFKKRKGLCCSSCGIQSDDQKHSKYFDVDHIIGYRKTDCRDENLQILCTLCHTYKDHSHLDNARLYPHRNKRLHEFVKKFHSYLTELKNQYLKRYERELIIKE